MAADKHKLWSSLALGASIVCLLVMAGAVMGVRLDWFNFRTASNILGWAARFGVLTCTLALILMLVIRGKQRSAFLKSILTAVLLLGPLAVLIENRPPSGPPPGGSLASKPSAPGASGPASRPGPLNDISTDTRNPPVYQAVVPLRPEGSNPIEYDFNNSPRSQQKLFPEIGPIVSDLPKPQAFRRALTIAERMGWQIVAQDPEQGVIEAIASTFYFGFKDDVVVRVRANEAGSIIDIRSHSRVGRGDRGKNAARVKEFIKRFERD